MNLAAQKARAFYTQLLRLVYNDTLKREAEPLTHVLLWGAMRRLGFQVGQNRIKDALDHFRDRKWVTFTAQEDELTGAETYTAIKIAPDGRVALKGLKPDETLEIESES